MKNAPDEDRVQRARQARQVISGSDIRPPAPSTPTAYSPSSTISVQPAGLFSLAQRNYLIAVAVLLVLGVILYVTIGFGIASVIFFLLALSLLAGWIVF